jgi:hypothetical protein
VHRIAYIFPIIALGVSIYLFKPYQMEWVYVLSLALSELLIYMIIRRASRKAEYLGAYSIRVEYHEDWTERVVTTESYTDSQGRTQTRQRVRYVHHPEEWHMIMNTGRDERISQSTYEQCRSRWRTEGIPFRPPHINCVRGGGGLAYSWDGVYEHAATCTYKGLYVNYITNSHSLFRHSKPNLGEQEELGLIDYPKFSSNDLDIDPVLISGKLKGIESDPYHQRAIQLINGVYGSRHQIHVFVLLFDGTLGVETALRQKAHWEGGNKNEFVLCLGVIPDQENGHKVAWCEPFLWCDIPRLETASKSWFIENPTLDLCAYAAWLRENLGLWKRKEFKDFKYLGVRLSPGRKALVFLASLLLSVGIGVIFHEDYRARYGMPFDFKAWWTENITYNINH